MNPMPPFVHHLIVAFVGFPAALARSLAIGYACVAGTFWLSGTSQFLKIPSSLAFLIAIILSLIAYLMIVCVDYVTAKHRDAVPMNTLIECLLAEIVVQVAGTAGVTMLLAGMFDDQSQPLYMCFGPLLCIASLTMAFAYNRRIKEWKAAWNGHHSVVPAPASDGAPII